MEKRQKVMVDHKKGGMIMRKQTSGRRKETKVFINQDTYEYLVANKGDKSLSYAIAEIVEQHIEKMKNPPVRF